MSYSAKNYTEQGGDVTHFGGKVVFEEGCVIQGLPDAPAVPVAENQAASEASTVATLKEDLNSLLAKLKTAGLMAADNVEETGETESGAGEGSETGSGEDTNSTP